MVPKYSGYANFRIVYKTYVLYAVNFVTKPLYIQCIEKNGKELPVSGLTCKELRSCHSHCHKKKAEGMTPLKSIRKLRSQGRLLNVFYSEV